MDRDRSEMHPECELRSVSLSLPHSLILSAGASSILRHAATTTSGISRDDVLQTPPLSIAAKSDRTEDGRGGQTEGSTEA